MTDIVKELCATKCNREPFTPLHAECQCLVANKAADEIQRLRAVVERQRNALKSILNEVHYGGTDLNDEPDIDRIHDFATTGLREDRLVTANTTANTADATTDETDATP